MSAFADGGRSRIAALYRHPVKGFTPERLAYAELEAGEHFPHDRLYAVETGPSGFDPAAPSYLNKMNFAVLARMPQIARIRVRYDVKAGQLTARAEGMPDFEDSLESEAGREAFARWLENSLAGVLHAPLNVLRAPSHHAFMDEGGGFVSIINLASVRDLEEKIGRPLDPLRFRANLYVEGWPAWAELEMTGAGLDAGAARLEGVEPIARCTATHVDPQQGVRDVEVVQQLTSHYGHRMCGLYARVTQGGVVAEGDAVRLAP